MITIPKPGKPYAGPFQGQAAFRGQFPPALVAEFVGGLRRYPGRGERGRARIYIDDEERTIPTLDGSYLPEEDDHAPQIDLSMAAPTGSDAAVLIDRKQELARIDAKIAEQEQRLKDTRTRVDAAVKQYEDRLLQTMTRCEDEREKALIHHQTMRAIFWQLDVQGQAVYLDQATALDGSMRKILEIRQTRDELLGKSGVAAWLELGRAALKDLEDSTIGQAIGLQASAAMSGLAAKVASFKNDNGDTFTADDAMAAMVKEGRVFRERRAAIEMFAAHRPRCHLSQAAGLAVRILYGDAKLEALAALVKAHEVGDAT